MQHQPKQAYSPMKSQHDKIVYKQIMKNAFKIQVGLTYRFIHRQTWQFSDDAIGLSGLASYCSQYIYRHTALHSPPQLPPPPHMCAAAAARRAGYRAQRISVLVVRIPLLFFPQSALSLLSVTSSSFFAAMLTKSHLWSFYSSVFPRKPEKFVSISQLIRRHDNLLSRFTDLQLLIGEYLSTQNLHKSCIFGVSLSDFKTIT